MELDADMDRLPIRRTYIRIAGDLIAGSLLSQIVYWYRPDISGKSKLRVERAGKMWIAKTREQWMEECAITLSEYKRAIKTLQGKGFIEVSYMRFAGLKQTHVRLLLEPFLIAITTEPAAQSVPI